MGKDYYAILGVPRDVDENALKAAYKKAALKHHPDRNRSNPEAASVKFKEAAEAFEVLSDKNKRAVYDQFGEDGLKAGGGGAGGGPGGPPPGFTNMGGFPGGSFTFSSSSGGSGFQPMDPNDLFAKVFAMNGGGGGGGFGGIESLLGGSLGGGGASSRRTASPFAMGDEMFGGAGMPGAFSSRAAHASGNGHSNSAPPDDSVLEDVVKPLQLSLEELYKGVTKKLKVTRKLRDGRMVEKTCEVNVKPGWKAGTKIKFPGMGNEDQHGRAAAMVFEVAEKPHPLFTREGDDLIYIYPISLVEALTGSPPSGAAKSPPKRTVKHLDDRLLEFKLSLPTSAGGQPVKPGQEIVIPNEGMPITRKGAPKSKGDLRIRIKVDFPTRVSSTQVEALKRILGGTV